MDIVSTLPPIPLLVGLGYYLKRLRLFDADFGRTLLKFVFLATTPALTLRSISQLHLSFSLLALLILPVILISGMADRREHYFMREVLRV